MEPGAKLALFALLCYTPWIWEAIVILIKNSGIKWGPQRKSKKRESKPHPWKDPES